MKTESTYFQQATAFQMIQGDCGVIYDAEGRTEICLDLPKASSVCVSLGDTENYPLDKGEDGLWRGRLNLSGGFHYVNILVDGQIVILPQLPIGFGCSRTINFLDVPFEGDAFYQLGDVPHGTVARHYYPSSVTGRTESCLVYCPPGGEGKELPTLYLQHGLGENETGWVHQGRVNFIMDNLLAEGKAVPMRIVMGNGMVQPERLVEPLCVTLDNGMVLFRGMVDTEAYPDVLMKDLIPYIEKTYAVSGDKWNRAVAGLSMGSMHASAAAMTHPETFGWVGLFSGFLRMIWKDEQPHLAALEDAEAFADHYRLFLRAMGERDEFMPIFLEDDAILERKGVKTLRKVYAGAHEWQVWRECARDFLPMLFR